MTATALPIVTVKDSFDAVTALSLNYVYTAADVANGNSFVSTGREIVLVQNTDSGGHHVSVVSVADAFGRTGDITAYAVAAGLFSVLPYLSGAAGWKQTDGTIHLSADDATVKFAVLRLPR